MMGAYYCASLDACVYPQEDQCDRVSAALSARLGLCLGGLWLLVLGCK